MPRDDAKQDKVQGKDEIDRFGEARSALKQIFDLLEVERVIVVDDDLNSDPQLSDFTQRCFRFFNQNPLRLRCIDGLELQEGVEEDFDEDIRPQLEDIWGDLDEVEQSQLMEKLDWIAPEKTVSALKQLCEGYQIDFLSLQGWRDSFAANTSDDALAKTIFLFDLDMSKEVAAGGCDDEGMRLISEMLKSGRNCQCALFSHRVEEDAEYDAWREYVADYDLKEYQHDFVVISKKHLPKAPIVFAQRLKRAAIAPLCDELTEEVVNVLDAALGDAKREIDDLNIYDFEEIVFQSSHNEGVWEPDTVLRILALYTQRSARRRLKENKRVEGAAAQVRKVIDFPYRPPDAPAPSSREILRLERYEEKAFLCDHLIPLDLGDIFRNEDGQEFVLLAQQCNIMCRNSDDFVRPHSVTIAPLVVKGKVKPTPRLWEMEAYATGKGEYTYVDFLDVISVPILALDLTVFNNNGKSVFYMDSVCPLNAIPAWRKRHEQVSDEIKSIVGRYATASIQLANEGEPEPAASEPSATNDAEEVVVDNGIDTQQLLCHALTNSVSGAVVGAIDLESRMISYNIERVSRLKPPYASALLRAYAAYLARDGFDHDLTRTNQSPRAS